MARGKKREREEIEGLITKLAPFMQRGLTYCEACVQARIPASTISDYMQKFEWVRNEIEYWEAFLETVAETTVASKIINKDVDIAKWYLERRKKNKYSTKSEVENTGKASLEDFLSQLKELGKLN